MAKKTAAKKTASKKKRTAAQKRATAKLVAMNKKKRASKKKASARTGSVSTGRRSAAKVRGYPGGARRTNPANRATFYVIVRRDTSGVDNYLYFDGSKFIKKGEGRPFLKGPKSYMMELAQAVADEYPKVDVFVKAE